MLEKIKKSLFLKKLGSYSKCPGSRVGTPRSTSFRIKSYGSFQSFLEFSGVFYRISRIASSRNVHIRSTKSVCKHHNSDYQVRTSPKYSFKNIQGSTITKNIHPNEHFPHNSNFFPQKGEPTFFIRKPRLGAETQDPGHKNSWPLGKLLHHNKKVRIENGAVWFH